jgi:hypothetical protein
LRNTKDLSHGPGLKWCGEGEDEVERRSNGDHVVDQLVGDLLCARPALFYRESGECSGNELA